MTPADRRKLIEAPITITTHGSSSAHGGCAIDTDDSCSEEERMRRFLRQVGWKTVEYRNTKPSMDDYEQ